MPLRTFRLDRIDGDVTINKIGDGYEIPAGFDVFASLNDQQRAYCDP